MIWALVIGGIIVSGWFGYRYFTEGELPAFVAVSALKADPEVDETPVSDEAVASHTVGASEPRYISIPRLEIAKARIFAVGIDKNNLLESSKNIDDAGWFDRSATPGAGYSAVLINGHNEGITRDGLFAALETLENGDVIQLERGDGQEFIYKVVEKQAMPLEQFAKSGMKSMLQSAEPDKEGLNLVTAAGKWVPSIQQFDQRIILRAVIAT